MKPLHIPIIIGTSREGRLSAGVAQYVQKQMAEAGISTELVDVRDFMTPYTEHDTEDPKETAWKELVAWSDAFIIVTPEYNHSFPGELKILLDKAKKEYDRKPVAICTVSTGNLGGARVYEHLLPVLVTLGLVPVPTATYFTNADTLFTETGELAPESAEQVTDRFSKMLKSLLWYAYALKNARDTE